MAPDEDDCSLPLYTCGTARHAGLSPEVVVRPPIVSLNRRHGARGNSQCWCSSRSYHAPLVDAILARVAAYAMYLNHPDRRKNIRSKKSFWNDFALFGTAKAMANAAERAVSMTPSACIDGLGRNIERRKTRGHGLTLATVSLADSVYCPKPR